MSTLSKKIHFANLFEFFTVCQQIPTEIGFELHICKSCSLPCADKKFSCYINDTNTSSFNLTYNLNNEAIINLVFPLRSIHT